MSKRSRSAALKNAALSRAKSTPEPPGPPGLTSRVPIRFLLSVAGRRASAMSTVGPYGCAQSIGTVSVPHCAAGSSAHAFQCGPAERAACTGVAIEVTVARTVRNTARIGRVVARTGCLSTLPGRRAARLMSRASARRDLRFRWFTSER